MSGVKVLNNIADDTLFGVLCDFVVTSNLAYIAIEVDFGHMDNWQDIFLYCRFGFLAWCAIEFVIRIGGAGIDFFYKPRNFVELAMVSCAVIDVAINTKPGWLWRMSGLRAWRLLRVYEYARTSERLKELSTVLDAAIRSWKAMAYLALVFFFTFYSTGVWAKGILTAGGSITPGSEETEGLNVDQYFGNSLKTALTMFQMSTCDGWAETIVRPILQKGDLFGALMLTGYTWGVSYTLVSLGIGVMVWATVEEARSGGDHASHMQALEDRHILKEVRTYFEASLALQERSHIDYQELQDAFMIPEIVSAFQVLELPVTDAATMFAQLGNHDFVTTTDELMDGIVKLSQKATPFDTCCLTATIGGTASYTTHLCARSTDVVDTLRDIRHTLKFGIDELTRAVQEEPDLKEVPEVVLRKAGKINHHVDNRSQRYTA